MNGQDAKPTDGAYERFAHLNAELAEHLAALAQVMQTDLAAFNQVLAEQQVSRVIVPVKMATVPGTGR